MKFSLILPPAKIIKLANSDEVHLCWVSAIFFLWLCSNIKTISSSFTITDSSFDPFVFLLFCCAFTSFKAYCLEFSILTFLYLPWSTWEFSFLTTLFLRNWLECFSPNSTVNYILKWVLLSFPFFSIDSIFVGAIFPEGFSYTGIR